MQKTKYGISAGLLGAAAYFAALLGGWTPVLLVTGFILLTAEQNDWLRRCAVRALIIYGIITLTPAVLSVVDDVFGFFNTMLGWFGAGFRLRFPGNIDSLLRYAVRVVGNVLLLVMGLQALHIGSVLVAPVEKFLDKHM